MEGQVINFINKACGLKSTNRYFPGGQPVSLNRELLRSHFGSVKDGRYSEYSLAFKADGKRALLVIIKLQDGPKAFLLFRDLSIETLLVPTLPQTCVGSCFDTELVPVGKSGERSIFIFDTICIENHSVRDLYYPLRVEIARRFVAQQTGADTGFSAEPGECPSNFINALVRNFAPGTHLSTKKIYRLDSMIQRRNMTPQLEGTDGFVFTDNFSAYNARDKVGIFKWKPLEEITVDFAVTDLHGTETLTELPPEYCCYQVKKGVQGLWVEDKFVSKITVEPGVHVRSGSIYECAWTGKEWNLILERSDKTHSNSFKTFIKTLENLEEGIGLEEVEKRIQFGR